MLLFGREVSNKASWFCEDNWRDSFKNQPQDSLAVWGYWHRNTGLFKWKFEVGWLKVNQLYILVFKCLFNSALGCPTFHDMHQITPCQKYVIPIYTKLCFPYFQSFPALFSVLKIQRIFKICKCLINPCDWSIRIRMFRILCWSLSQVVLSLLQDSATGLICVWHCTMQQRQQQGSQV